MMGSPRKGIVIAFGRFNPPTTGHEALLRFVQQVARQRSHAIRQDIRIYPSLSQDPKKNPLPFRDKLRFLRMLFPQFTFNDNPNVRTVYDAITDCVAAGYTDLTLIAGSDRVPEYTRLARYAVPPNSPKYQKDKHLPLYSFEVVGVPGERSADEEGIGGMSASKQREFARMNDFDSFERGVPSHNESLARMLFASVRKHMELTEHLNYLKRMRQRVTESYNETQLREDHLKVGDTVHAGVGHAGGAGFKGTVDKIDGNWVYVNIGKDKYGVRIIKAPHRNVIKEADSKLVPKQPTAVDNLKKKQKQELLSLKQRQSTELTTAQIRDLEIKSREQQQKMNAPKPASR